MIRLLAIKVGGFSSVLLSIAAWGIGSLATLKALTTYLGYTQHRYNEIPTSISAVSFIFFAVAGLHIEFASLLSGTFFVIPGLLIYSSAFLAQSLIAKHGLGPFDAIAESVGKTQGNVWRIALLFVAFWLLLLIVNWIITFAFRSIQSESVVLSFIQWILSTEIELVSYALMAVVYARLNLPNQSKTIG
ncbi:MAG TPA: hypothetical protein VGJ90_01315 [Methylophilaceae bacterium]